jgi:hypothetical protein
LELTMTIVRERYPVSNLPDDIREELGPVKSVRLIIEPNDEPQRSLSEILEEARRLRAEGKIKPITTEEAVARIRALRDEWDT